MLKNITLSAEADLIEQAREKARKRHTTLNSEFREWLSRYAGQEQAASCYQALMDSLSHVEAGRSFSREEMNER